MTKQPSRLGESKTLKRALFSADALRGDHAKLRNASDGRLALGAGLPVEDIATADLRKGPAHKRKLFITDGARFGIGPRKTRLGDLCCIVFGSKVLLIIRRTEGKELYRLVGECYIQGVMTGLIAELGLRGVKEIRDIALV